MDIEHIKQIPYKDLRTINQLWLAASKGKFGFSVQKQIWINLGGQLGQYDKNVFKHFLERVEWEYNKVNFDPKGAVKGHLPLAMYALVERNNLSSHWIKELTKILVESSDKKIEKELTLPLKKESIKNFMFYARAVLPFVGIAAGPVPSVLGWGVIILLLGSQGADFFLGKSKKENYCFFFVWGVQTLQI